MAKDPQRSILLHSEERSHAPSKKWDAMRQLQDSRNILRSLTDVRRAFVELSVEKHPDLLG